MANRDTASMVAVRSRLSPAPQKTPTASRAALGTRSPVEMAFLGSPESVLTLQRLAGNQAVAALFAPAGPESVPETEGRLAVASVQRRVPKPDSPGLSKALDPTRAASDRLTRKLRRGMSRSWATLTDDQKTEARGHFPDMEHGMTLDEAVDPNSALMQQDPRNLLRDATEALRHGAEAGGRHELSVYYPGTVRQGPPKPGSTAKTNLTTLVDDARDTMDDIAGGGQDAAVALVFGPDQQVQDTAKQRFGAASEALNRLRKDHKILIDLRQEFGPLGVGGLTTPKQMELGHDVVADSTVQNRIKVVHESTHAVAGANVQDHRYRNTPGWTNLPTDVKLKNAAHFEAVAAKVLLDEDPAEPPVPVQGPGGDPIRQARAHVNQWITHAWVGALRVHEFLVIVARRQRAPFQAVGFRKPAALLWNASRLLGLTMHHRAEPPKVPRVLDLDLSLAEDRVSRLADAIPMTARCAVDPDPKATRRARLKAQLLADLGPIRKNDQRDLPMVESLVQIKDTVPGALRDLPDPMQAVY